MKNGFRRGSAPAIARKGVDPSARLQKSRAALVKLKQTLKNCQLRLKVRDKELAAQAKTNIALQRKLIRLEKRAVDVSYLAYHDALTGLPNRRLLLDRLNQAIAQAARQKKIVALVFFDVDGFKEINDTLGHSGGDQLLQDVAQRLSACMRAADTACRYGGDEFIVLLPEIDGQHSVAVVEQKILDLLTGAYLIGGTTVRLTLSIGSAVYPVQAKDHRDLIRLADTAMYHSKANGERRVGGLKFDRELTPKKC